MGTYDASLYRLEAPLTDAEDAHRPHLLGRRMSDVEPEAVDWLWPGRFPLGKLSLLVGDPGRGKSFITLDIAARMSRGVPWPDIRDEPTKAGVTILFSAEDGAADTIRPRLDAAEADASRVHFIDAVKRTKDGEPGYFSLATDIRPLEDTIIETGARLVIIDPVSAYLGGVDSHSNGDVRGLLAPLAGLASEHGCAVIVVSHLNKSGGSRAMYRAMGSLAFVAAARIAWGVIEDPDDDKRRLVLPIKSNLIAKPQGIAFRIVDGRVHWDAEPVDADIDTILNASDTPRGPAPDAINEAKDWLLELLADGAMESNDIKAEAKEAGFSWRTVWRAKDDLGVKSRKRDIDGKMRSCWWLPDPGDDG